MNNYGFKLLGLISLLFVSCTDSVVEEYPIEEEQKIEFKPLVINAIADSVTVSSDTRAAASYSYKVKWETNDEINVTDGTNSSLFILTEGAGTDKGVFKQKGAENLSGTVTCYYPSSLLSEGKLYWPASQQYSSSLTNVPMISSNTIKDGGTNFGFRSLGGVVQAYISSPIEGIKLTKIEVSAENTGLSGEFTFENEKCVMTETDTKYSVLFNEPLDIYNQIRIINISLPTFDSQKVTLYFYAEDGRVGTANYTHNNPRATVTRLPRVVNNFDYLPITYTYKDENGNIQNDTKPVSEGTVSLASFGKDPTNPQPLKIVSVNIPYGVSLVDEKTFMSEELLTEVILPEGLLTIGTSCFANASALESIDIPSTVTSIGAEAFFNCGKLTKISFEGTTPPDFAKGVFAYCAQETDALLLVEVPQGTSLEYQAKIRAGGSNTSTKIRIQEKGSVSTGLDIDPEPSQDNQM